MKRNHRELSRLSIGLPVYNGEKFLEETLANLLSQTFGDFELVISDNASSDRTEEICRDFCHRDPRVKYFRNANNIGAHPNFERAFQLCSAPLFKWAAVDDVCLPNFLETCVKLLDADPSAVMAHSGTTFIDECGEPFPFDKESGQFLDPKTGVGQTPDSADIGTSASAMARFWSVLKKARWATHVFGVIRRESLKKTVLLPNFASSDRVMLAELALLGRFQASPDRLFCKRFHGEVSWALNQKELRAFIGANDEKYSRRLRQLNHFFAAPWDKPISLSSRVICTAMVAVHSIKTSAEATLGKDRRTALQGVKWRAQKQDENGMGCA